MAQNKNSLKNLSKQSAQSHTKGIKAFTARLNCLNKIVIDRKANFIPMGDLPSAITAFYEEDTWIPESEDKESMKVTKNVIYAKHEQNEVLLKDLKLLLEDIKSPRSTKKVFDEQELEIKKLENQVKNLAAENLRIEIKYKNIIDRLKAELQISETNKNRYKQLLENNSEVIPFPKR
ncbi:hypothetical protein P3596_19975 [Vibrio parahaemolyticus]|uniref:hypothetical protein n=1 Tax=Vibrio harveyi group TaxID=717610 RepID=UPI0015B747D0|nr:hypothetical protein [Vibrio parahaemolyticus]MCR9819982.1 hypothetical protein [Vibrio parahaemolyticus]MDF4568884.1 hypothetical protein [Vibrio parahaemolyticus]MDF5009162.1 hypothetical protein [Vibrio parahaemolyticus]NWK16029.1 hypothetical protein [Vibrio parahaemolyticus]